MVWDNRKLKAVYLVVSGLKTLEEIASEVGVAPSTISKWKAQPEFRDRVELLLEEREKRLLKAL